LELWLELRLAVSVCVLRADGYEHELRLSRLRPEPWSVMRSRQKVGQVPLAAAGRRQLEQWIELQLAVSECE
jgi:hypothetical protein